MSEDVPACISADQYELYAEFGITAEKAQVLELAAGDAALSFLAIFADTGDVTPEETETYRAIVDDVDRMTFGKLLGRLKKTLNFSDSLITIVDEALERRNYLIHRFFRFHNFALSSEDGRKVMVDELKEIQGKLDLAHKILDAVSSILLQIGGHEELSMERVLEMQAEGKRVNI